MTRRELQRLRAIADDCPDTVTIPKRVALDLIDVAIAAINHVEGRTSCQVTELGGAVAKLMNGGGKA